MSGKHQGLRYFQKFLNSKASERNALAKKVLRYVMAVGFVLSPWLGGEAYADAGIVRVDNITVPNSLDKTYLQNDSNVAHIYAEQASGDVGLNRFKTFEVGAGQIANLYFKTSATDTNHLNTLVNTVQNQISISGTVNGIKDGNVGGNLYFLSPKGMVVGSSGVINAGSLTMITSGTTFDTPAQAADAITANNWELNPTAPIDIHGQINTATGIDLRAAYINVVKPTGADANTPAPSLKTGVKFKSLVNVSSDNYKDLVDTGRLNVSLDDKGNIVIADPSNTGAQGEIPIQGDGSIKLAAYSDSKNTNTEFLGVTSIDNTVEAKVEVGEGATIDARGNVEISAEAKRLQRTKITEFWDMVAFTKADATVNGSVAGADVKIAATASSEYSGGNYANVLDMLNDGMQETGVIGLKSKFSSYLLGLVESNPH